MHLNPQLLHLQLPEHFFLHLHFSSSLHILLVIGKSVQDISQLSDLSAFSQPYLEGLGITGLGSYA